jgi:phosphoribosylamine--glycine ligase
MKILVLGSGAREHAIIKALIRTGTNPEEITCAPGNGGISQEVTTVSLDANSPERVTNWALEANTDLVVIGPEAPLVAGVSDALREAGIAVFGPSKAAAALEGSKAFAKDVMAAADVPTGMARKCSSTSEVESALEEYGAPYVVKADGLAAGKGVIVTSDKQDALDHANTFLNQGMEILVEEFLDGEEVSLFFLADGTSVVPLSPAQDFKRAYNFDQGPNTGGMGAYSPLPWLPEGFVQEVQDRVALPTVRELARLGTPFVGLLYCGLIITSKGIRVIEFNARFGDPETQVVLRRLVTPLSHLLHNAATGHLAEVAEPELSKEMAVTIVLASEGYPVTSAPDREITGILSDTKSVEVAHAATKLINGKLIATGGRVLSVVSIADTFHEARKAAYKSISEIKLEGSHYRTDIALKVDEVQDV